MGTCVQLGGDVVEISREGRPTHRPPTGLSARAASGVATELRTANHRRRLAARSPARASAPEFAGEPDMTTTIFNNDSPGIALAIWSIKALSDEIQVAIEACNVQTGRGAHYRYFCSYVMNGRA